MQIFLNLLNAEDEFKERKARALQTLHVLIKSEKRIFDGFRPTPEVIAKMRLAECVMDSDINLSSLAA